MEWLWPIGLLLIATFCWALNLLSIPGNWLVVGLAAGYAVWGPQTEPFAIGWTVITALVAVAVLGEIIEFAAGAMGVSRRGGSRRSAVLALLGSLIGAVVGIFVGLPIPLIGSLLAALFFAGAGALTGAVLGEQWKGRDMNQSWEIGKAAFWGRLLGTFAKILCGSIMLALLAAGLLLPWTSAPPT